MKKNGYTLMELIVLIVGLGLIALIGIKNASYAFTDNKDELYHESIVSILECAKQYGNDNLETLKEEKQLIITVNELIEKNYIGSDEDGNYIDVRDENETLNNTKIAIEYNEKTEEITTEVVN